jgi:hypothetical protein
VVVPVAGVSEYNQGRSLATKSRVLDNGADVLLRPQATRRAGSRSMERLRYPRSCDATALELAFEQSEGASSAAKSV